MHVMFDDIFSPAV